MLIIYQQGKVQEGDTIILSTAYEMRNAEGGELWFSFPVKYDKYLVTENADAAVIGLLLLAMKNAENIEVEGSLSARLFYQLNHYLIPALNLANSKWKPISIEAKELNTNSLNQAGIAGTGLTCGVDSLATVCDHLNELEPFDIRCFTFFNAGSHGNFGGDMARDVFKKRRRLVKRFSDEVGKDLLWVDSNINEILIMDHQQTHTIRDAACVLNLQKLFRYYYYASAYRFDYFKLNDRGTADYDILLLSMLSTESTTFYSSAAQYTRVERTNLIVDYSPSYEYLNVCTRASATGEVENCSTCNKCLRTQLTLESLQKLPLYEDVFDLRKYRRKRTNYIGRVLSERKSNMLSKEIYELMRQTRLQIPLLSYFYCLVWTIIRQLRSLYKKYLGSQSRRR